MPPSATDPAEWSRSSHEPDIAGGIDTLDDVLREVAHRELADLHERDRNRLVKVITRVALAGIREASLRGLLHDGDNVAWSPKFLEIVAHLVSDILDARNPRLMVQCMDFAFGLGLQLGVSEQDIADLHQMTRSNVSKICVGLCERYQIPPSRGMRSIATREHYSARQQGRRAKPSPEPWTHKGVFITALGINGIAA